MQIFMLTKIKEMWCQKLSYATFRLEFWKNFTLEISTLKFVKMQSFMLKKKKKNLDQKSLFWVLLGQNLKILLSYLKTAP